MRSFTGPDSRVAVQPRPPGPRKRASGNCSPGNPVSRRRFRKSSVPRAECAVQPRAAVAAGAKCFVPGSLLPLRAQRGRSPGGARAGDPRGLSTGCDRCSRSSGARAPCAARGGPRQLRRPCGPYKEVSAAPAKAVRCWARPGAREGKAEAARPVADREDLAPRPGCPQHPRLPSAASPAP